MFGFNIIKCKKLQEMQQSEESFQGIITGKDAEISSLKLQVETLSEKLAKFDRKRVNGKFCKTTI
jgi:hypothetical protein